MAPSFLPHTGNVLEDVLKYPDCHFHTLLSDVPYNLNTQWKIGHDGTYQVKGNANDFMGKWAGLTGPQLNEFFAHSFRILKHGGYAILFGLDRQLGPFQYYAVKNGFEVCQSMYWYYISNFPKAADAGKAIDKKLGEEREVIGKRQHQDMRGGKYARKDGIKKTLEYSVSTPTSPLAKEFDGYKYGIAPLKQVVETIMVFRKPVKSGSVVGDIVAAADDCSPAVVNVNEGRIPLQGEKAPTGSGKMYFVKNQFAAGATNSGDKETPGQGRFPANAFVCPAAGAIIDAQSGELKSGDNCIKNNSASGMQPNAYGTENRPAGTQMVSYGDCGGASRILHTITYEESQEPLFIYEPKVSGAERNAGLASFENAEKSGSYHFRENGSLDGNITIPAKNPHPTLKPINLICHIATLFKLPAGYSQQWYVPFSGAGSEVIGIHKAGIPLGNITACEISDENNRIAAARIKWWAKKMEHNKTLPAKAYLEADAQPPNQPTLF